MSEFTNNTNENKNSKIKSQNYKSKVKSRHRMSFGHPMSQIFINKRAEQNIKWQFKIKN